MNEYIRSILKKRFKKKSFDTHATIIESSGANSLCLARLHFQMILDYVRYVRRVGND